MKFPTLIGLALLITAITLGVLIHLNKEELDAKEKQKFIPKDIKVVDIFEDEVTITWQTDQPIIGNVIYGQGFGEQRIQMDNRNRNNLITPTLVHFVTIKGFQPNTSYWYQIQSQKSVDVPHQSPLSRISFLEKSFFPLTEFSYPDYQLSFKTAPKSTAEDAKIKPFKPIRGSILNSNFNPVDEALIYLDLKNAQSMASFASTAGNFVIPLTGIRFSDLKDYYPLTENTPATLTIIKGGLKSEIQILIPLTINNLPPVIIGQNLSLKNYQPPQLPQEATESSTTVDKTQYDLNGDGTINSLDRAIILQNFGNNPLQPKTDLNKDGTVDQKDIDLLSEAL